MKVLSFNHINTISSKGLEKKSAKKQADNNISRPIINNSLSEAIGRSQISFKGDLTSDFRKIYYTPKKNLLSSGSEQLEYDKNTHCLTYRETYANGALKREFIHNPSNNTEINKEYEKDGSGFEEYTSDTEQFRKELGPKGQLLSSRRTYRDGSFETLNYEYQNGRTIYRHYNQMSGLDDVRVYDIETNAPLGPNNPKVIAEVQTTTPDGLSHYKRYNLLTNYIYEEQVRNGKRLIEGYRKNNNDIIIWQAHTDDKGALHEYMYDDSGNIERDIIQDFANMCRYEKTYNKFGCLDSNIKIEYDSKNRNYQKTTFFNVTFGHPYKIITKNGNEELLEEFDDKGFPTYEKRSKKNVILNQTTYYPNTIRPHYVLLNISNQKNSKFEYQNTVYDINGKRKRIELLNNGCTEQIEFFNPDYNYVEKTRVIDNRTGGYTDYLRDSKGIINQKKDYDASNNLTYEAKYYYNTENVSHETYYLPDGAIKKIKYSSVNVVERIEYISSDKKTRTIDEYYPNSSRIREKHIYDYVRKTLNHIKYDEYGNVTYNTEEKIETPEYRRKKQEQQQYQQYQQYQQNQQYGYERNTQKTPNSIEDIISELSGKVFKSNFSIIDISAEDWETFAKFIGLNSAKELLEMDKKTYRETMKKIHPDLRKEDEKKLYEEVSKIVNRLYERNSK